MPENKENNKDQQAEAKQPEPKQEKNLDNLSQTHGKVEKFRPTNYHASPTLTHQNVIANEFMET